MKKFTAIIISAFGIAIYGCNSASENKAAETPTDTAVTTSMAQETAPPMDSAAMMKAWMDYMTPGDVHKMMASWDGKWNEEVTMWMKPDAPPQKSSAMTENKMIMGGRYQQSTHKGSFNGMSFEGMGLLAYDNAKKTFQSSWVDNMGTGIMQMEGTWDDAAKTINFKGTSVDPSTGKTMDVRETMKIEDDKNQTMEMYMKEAGKEFKTMEIHFSRK